MNKIIIGIITTILVLGGLIWIARPDSQSNNIASIKSNGTLAVEEANNYDFGAISMSKGIVTHQFKIKNTSDEAVVVNKIYTSCMCTTAKFIVGDKQIGPVGMPGHGAIPSINQTISPNEEAIVEVVFDPAAHGPAGVGRIQRTVTLENNAGQPIELQFTAVVTP
ncbi:MAG: DUF1573 domain-containing protein [Candidatus Zambryskibacteria bacterium]|nr:DUF1573 domain-containing protein [Candidatus Zambryskibacteria bacterium]